MDSDPVFDIIVVGSGAAGLTAAIESGSKRVLIVTKTGSFTSGSSPLAQGGIAASTGSDDSPDLHYDDTIKAGVFSGISDQISFLTQNGESAIENLIKLNMQFDKNEHGDLDRNKEAAHSRRRVLKAGGDATGRVLVETLYSEAVKRSNIHWKSNFFVYDLVLDGDTVQGVVGYSKDSGWQFIRSQRVILATGGLGQLFGHTTNPKEATGDSMAIALRSGLRLKEIEMVQFHPTALNVKNGDSLMLLTEALRGDGAILVKKDGTPFMGKYSPLKELAPRDVVSRGIWSEIINGFDVFLDLTKIDNIGDKFPTVTSFCLKVGLNPNIDLIPVTPAVHYVMGGVDINSILPKGLGVAGEAAYTGVHGANRLASNSLLECLVYGKSEALRVLKENHELIDFIPEYLSLSNIKSGEIIKKYRSDLQKIMYTYCGIIRNETLLEKGKVELKDLKTRLYKEKDDSESLEYSRVVCWLELLNMMDLGLSMIDSALYRKESRGAHYRDDYPEKSIKWDRIIVKELG
ncbi:MAG: L-aspartate oxidase [Spirochaetales bacterium]|nr:L-aspartate oxidase [Spirochaetales bacterium]